MIRQYDRPGDLSVEHLSVQLDDVSVRVGHVELRPGRQIPGLLENGHAVCAEMIERLAVAADAQRQVAVPIVDLARTSHRQRRRMDNQVQLPPLGELVPRAAEIKWWARDFG